MCSTCPRAGGLASWRAGRQGLSALLFSPDGKSLFGSVSEIDGDGFNHERLRSDLGPSHRKTDQSAHGRHERAPIYTPAGDRLVVTD